MTSDADPEYVGIAAEQPQVFWTVAHVLPSEWTGMEVQLDRWHQGDILGPLPATWIAPTGLDPITQAESSAASPRPFFSSEVNTWFIVVSQSCDIAATGTGVHQPFVMVAPLINASVLSKGNLGLARRHKIPYLFPTLNPDQTVTDSTWFADLRLIMPVSKAILLNREPVRGFEDGDALLRFAATVGHKFRRPALDSLLSEDLAQSINKYILDNGVNKPAFANTEHVRVVVNQGDILAPQSVHLIVLGRIKLDAESEQLWRDWEPKGRAILEAAGVELGPTLITTPEELTASVYRAATPIRVDSLGALRWP